MLCAFVFWHYHRKHLHLHEMLSPCLSFCLKLAQFCDNSEISLPKCCFLRHGGIKVVWQLCLVISFIFCRFDKEPFELYKYFLIMKETKWSKHFNVHAYLNRSIIQGQEKSEYFLKLSFLDLSELITIS